MHSYYHKDAQFTDPVFQNLTYKQTCAMWHMLCERGVDLEINITDVEANDITGSCVWNAHYTFSATGRKVHNIISADFTFQEGKIINHVDRFNLHRWMGMALGMKGKILGWFGPVQEKVRDQAGKGLRKFIENHPEYA